ncbi:UNVERIFIED_CONTAM: hypothetical protein HDU68_007226 [Siphonaria sp. JEL0065]|nr:hypothetical protein HDU68_007226 [Siphonaria sp. JEL0065]
MQGLSMIALAAQLITAEQVLRRELFSGLDIIGFDLNSQGITNIANLDNLLVSDYNFPTYYDMKNGPSIASSNENCLNQCHGIAGCVFVVYDTVSKQCWPKRPPNAGSETMLTGYWWMEEVAPLPNTFAPDQAQTTGATSITTPTTVSTARNTDSSAPIAPVPAIVNNITIDQDVGNKAKATTAAIGGAVGGIVAVALIVGFVYYRRRQTAAHRLDDDAPYSMSEFNNNNPVPPPYVEKSTTSHNLNDTKDYCTRFPAENPPPFSPPRPIYAVTSAPAFYRAVSDHVAENEGQLSLKEGQRLYVTSMPNQDGWIVTLNAPGLPSSLVLSRFIQSGSYAHVFEAVTEEAVYAVKAICKQGLLTSELRQQRIEAELLAALSKSPSSSAIVRVHAVSETSSHLFLVMDRFDRDLLDAINASTLCAAGPFYDPEDARDMSEAVKAVFAQILDAVDSCHRNGIFHQDIKPENILIKSNPIDHSLTACLSDFGLATKNPYPDTFGAGSVSYTSPESLAGLDENSRAQFYSAQGHDMWGVSVVLFMLITGRTPWYSARSSDPKYAEFQSWVKERKQHRINHGNTNLCPPSNLRTLFGFTAEVDDMFERLFDGANVGRRLKIHELREWVNSVDVFMDSEKLYGGHNSSSSCSASPCLRFVHDADQEGIVPDTRPWPKMEDLFMPRSWSSDISEMDYSSVPVFNGLNSSTSEYDHIEFADDLDDLDDLEDLENIPASLVSATTPSSPSPFTATTSPLSTTIPHFSLPPTSPQKSQDSFALQLDKLYLSSSSSGSRHHNHNQRGSKWNASEKPQLSRNSRHAKNTPSNNSNPNNTTTTNTNFIPSVTSKSATPFFFNKRPHDNNSHTTSTSTPYYPKFHRSANSAQQQLNQQHHYQQPPPKQYIHQHPQQQQKQPQQNPAKHASPMKPSPINIFGTSPSKPLFWKSSLSKDEDRVWRRM